MGTGGFRRGKPVWEVPGLLFRTFLHKETVPGHGAVSRVPDSPSATVLLGLACHGAQVGKGRSTGPPVCVPVREEAAVCYPLQMAASV